MRIASLLASATEVVYALGLGDQLVAISHECDYPPEALSKPRVSRPRFEPQGRSSQDIDRAVRTAMMEHGSVYLLDQERLTAAHPDLILTQAVCQVCAVPTSLAEEAVRLLEGDARVVSLDAHRVEDILQSIRQVGAAAGAAGPAERVVAGLSARLERARCAVAGLGRPTVLAIEWLDPPFVPGHWVPEMIELAGGTCLTGETGHPSREASWDELAGLDPDVLIVMPCGYGLERSRQEAEAYQERLAQVAPRALASRRAYVVDGSSYFNRSGPRVVDGIEILAGLLHGDQAPRVDLAGKAESL